MKTKSMKNKNALRKLNIALFAAVFFALMPAAIISTAIPLGITSEGTSAYYSTDTAVETLINSIAPKPSVEVVSFPGGPLNLPASASDAKVLGELPAGSVIEKGDGSQWVKAKDGDFVKCSNECKKDEIDYATNVGSKIPLADDQTKIAEEFFDDKAGAKQNEKISSNVADQIMQNSKDFFTSTNEFNTDALKRAIAEECKKVKGGACTPDDINSLAIQTKMSLVNDKNVVVKTKANLYVLEKGNEEQKQQAKDNLFKPFSNADGSLSYTDGAGKERTINKDSFKMQNGMLVSTDKEQCAGRLQCAIASDGQIYNCVGQGEGKPCAVKEPLSGFGDKKSDEDKKGKFGGLKNMLSVPKHTICSYKGKDDKGKSNYYSSPCPNGCEGKKGGAPGAESECLASADISYSGATKLLMGNEAYEQWLAKVDEIFKKYLPLTPDALSERMCKNFQQMPNGQNAAFVESPGGILNPAAHIQGERTTVLDIEINDTSLSETDCTANPESPECQQYSAASLTGTDETNTNTETATDETSTDEGTDPNDLTTAAVMIDRITGKAAGLPSGSASGIDTITGAGTNVAYEDIEAGEGEEANFTIVRKYVYKITWFVKNVQVQGSDPTLEYQLVLKGPGGVQEASNLKSLEEGASDGRAVTAPYTFADKRLFTSACLRFSKGYSKFKGMSGSELCNSIVDSSKKATVVDVGVPAGAQGSGAGSAEAGKFAIPQI